MINMKEILEPIPKKIKENGRWYIKWDGFNNRMDAEKLKKQLKELGYYVRIKDKFDNRRNPRIWEVYKSIKKKR